MINPIYEHSISTGENLFSKYAAGNEPGMAVNLVNGQTYPYAAFLSTSYIPITGNGNRCYLLRSYNGAFYDANKNFISGWNGDYNEMFLKAPGNARFIRTSVPNGIIDIFVVREYRFMTPKNISYKDDLAKEWELETSEKFYRVKLSGKISFVRDNFTFLNNAPFASKFMYVIEQSNDLGATWVPYWQGMFMKTDCEWNEDDLKVTIQPNVTDEYNDVLAGIEKEYNLIELAPAITPVMVTKRPLIQIYIPGDSVVSCFLGGVYWEQDANVVTNRNDLVQKYHFALCNLLKEMQITTNGSPNVNGLYVGYMKANNNNAFTGKLYPETANGYYVYAEQQYVPTNFSTVLVEIRRSSDNVAIFRYIITLPGTQPWDNVDFDAVTVPGSGSTGKAHVEMATYNIYARYLLDVDTIQDIGTYPIPGDDIVDYNRNYQRTIGYAIDVARISNNYMIEPTQWGLRDNGTYFQQPYSIYGGQFYPIARSTWRYSSIWFEFSFFNENLENKGRKQYTLRDAYPIASCINVLLKQIAPGITHEATEEYSQFLYGQSNAVRKNDFNLLITQKTNVLVGDYDQPAQKAITTLKQFTNMLRDTFRCFWYIEGGKFKIEHIQFFRNGGTYGYDPEIGIDTTKITNVRNGKPWGFDTSKWSFDKVDMPQRFQFKWMDDVTKGFEGFPIEIKSAYVMLGKIEDVNISNFTSDIDFMLLNPGSFSKDGFALMASVLKNIFYRDPYMGAYTSTVTPHSYTTPRLQIEQGFAGREVTCKVYVNGSAGGYMQLIFYNTKTGGSKVGESSVYPFTSYGQTMYISATVPNGATHICFYNSSNGSLEGIIYGLYVNGLYELPIETTEVMNVKYIMQNPYLSMIYLQPNYYVYDLPAMDVEINGGYAMVRGIERNKKQTLNFPVYNDPNPLKLIKTFIGTGQIDKISINLHSRSAKTIVKYDTE